MERALPMHAEMSEPRLRISNATIVTMNPTLEVFAPGELQVRGNRLEFVGRASVSAGPFDEDIDGTGMIAMPGLVNAHTHLHNALQRGIATEARTLHEWFAQIRPYGSRMTGSDVRISSELACLEMIESGTTCFADSSNVDYTAPVVERVGLRALLSSTSLDEGPRVDEVVAKRAAGREVSTIIGGTGFVVSEATRQRRDWHGKGAGRISVGFSVHSPESASPELHRRIAQAALAENAHVLEHVAESRASTQLARQRHGCSPVEFLESVGCLNERLLAAHCVQLSDGDIQLLASRRVSVAHNPVSNLRIGEVARIPALHAAGVNVGLGTDSSASNTDLDMFKELHFASLIQRTVAEQESWLGPMELLSIATIGSARALGLDAHIGSLEVGKLADLILVDMRATHLQPVTNPVGQLVSSARGSDVDTMIVDGRVLMRGHRVLSLNKRETLAAAQVAFDRIAGEISVSGDAPRQDSRVRRVS